MRAFAMVSLSRKREIEADAAARPDAIQTQIGALLAAVARLPNGEQVVQLAAAAAPLTRAVDTEPNAGAWITAPVGGEAEIDASTMKDASGTAEEASPAPGYNNGLDDGALPETELTAEDRSVRGLRITTSSAVEAKTLLMGGLRPPSRIAGVNEGTERSAIVTCNRHAGTQYGRTQHAHSTADDRANSTADDRANSTTDDTPDAAMATATTADDNAADSERDHRKFKARDEMNK